MNDDTLGWREAPDGFVGWLASVRGARLRDRLRWQVLVGLVAFLGTLAVPLQGIALRSSFDADDFRAEDEQVAETIASFSAEERRAALIVAGYPEELLEIQAVQRRSSEDFATLVSAYPREEQEQIWRLVRHPGIARDLARGGRKPDVELERIAAAYPIDDRAAIVQEGLERYPLWVQIYALDLEVEQSFESILARQSDEVVDAFEDVTNRPDLLTLLVDNMHMTTILGAVYRDDPQGVIEHFDTLHAEGVTQRQEEERVWSAQLSDPEQAEELDRAARAFAETYDYDLEDPPQERVIVETRVEVAPYPYWFGYPGWYDYAYWYPLPVWGHVGFTYGFGNGYVSVGLPSPFFWGWYYDYWDNGHNHRRNHGHHKGNGRHNGNRHRRDNQAHNGGGRGGRDGDARGGGDGGGRRGNRHAYRTGGRDGDGSRSDSGASPGISPGARPEAGQGPQRQRRAERRAVRLSRQQAGDRGQETREARRDRRGGTDRNVDSPGRSGAGADAGRDSTRSSPRTSARNVSDTPDARGLSTPRAERRIERSEARGLRQQQRGDARTQRQQVTRQARVERRETNGQARVERREMNSQRRIQRRASNAQASAQRRGSTTTVARANPSGSRQRSNRSSARRSGGSRKSSAAKSSGSGRSGNGQGQRGGRGRR